MEKTIEKTEAKVDLKSPLNGWVIEPAHDEKTHKYLIDGELVPSVTTVLKVLDKPALVAWAANQTAKKATELIARKTDKDGAVHIAFSEAQEILEEARKTFRETSGDAKDIGSMVHAAIERMVLGKPEEPVNDEGVANGLIAFNQWRESEKVKPVRVEALVGSKKYGFGGAVDFIGFIGGKLCLADWKTSTGIYDEYRIQVSAYLCAVEEMLAVKNQANASSAVEGKKPPKFSGAYILRFDKKTGLFNPKKDCVYLSRAECVKYFRAFKGILAYYQAIKEIK